MPEKFSIAGFRILNVNCDVTDVYHAFRTSGEDGITLKVEDTLSCRRSNDSQKNTALLEIKTDISSENFSDFKISLVSQAIFSFDEPPENLEDTLQNGCYPIARSKVYDAIKKITEAMGIPPIDLNSKQEPG